MHTTTYWIAVFGLAGFMGCIDLSDDTGTTASAVTSGDFSLSANPTAQTIKRGGTATYQIHVEALNGFTDTVTLTFTGRPNHDSGIFTDISGNLLSPATVTGSGDVLFDMRSPGHQSAIGTFTITIIGTSGSLQHSIPVQFTVAF
jgi:VCBS repeat-containing protein